MSRISKSGRLRAAIAAAFFLLPFLRAAAQDDLILTQHWALPTLYNPAAAGGSEWLRIRGAGRLQWLGIENAPRSFAGAADIPLKIAGKRAGAGLYAVQERLGLFENMLIAGQGSYRIKMAGGFLGIGLQGGYWSTRFRSSDAYVPDGDDYHDPDDPAIPKQDLSGSAVDISLGVSYSRGAFHAGISAMHITAPKVKMSVEGSESTESRQYESQLPRTFYFDAGGNIELKNTLFLLQPAIILATGLNSFTGNVSMRATYNRFLTFGLGYRWKDAFSIMAGATYRNFFLGYAFDWPLSRIAGASSGSHEIVAGYSMKLNLSGKNKNKHRSIRIM